MREGQATSARVRSGEPVRAHAARAGRRHDRRGAFERGMRAGFLAGLAVGLAVLGLVMWLWAVPTVDGALAAATEALGAVS